MRKVTKGGVTIKMWDLGGQVGSEQQGLLDGPHSARRCVLVWVTARSNGRGCMVWLLKYP